MFGKKFSQSNEPAIANIRMSHSENKMDERSDDVEKGQDVELGPMTRVRYLFSVGGMFCGSCSSTLETALVKLPGVEQCSVSIVTNQAIVTAKQGKVGEKMISDEIESMGYECVFIEEVILGADSSKVNTKQKFEFSIQGMSCGACAVTIENALNELPGVLNCSVSSITNKLLIEIETAHANACGPRDIISTIESIGYNAKLLDNSADGPQQKTYDEVAMWRNLMFIALIFGTPVVVLNFMSIDKGSNERLMQPIATDHGVVRYDVIMIVLNGILLLTVGFKYYRSAYYSAKHMAFGMDFLIATATSISFLYSLIVFSMGAQTGKPPVATYFDITGMLLLFITIGKYIESFSKGNSLSAIEELLKLQPSEALLVENLEITDGVQITSYNEEDYKVNSISINLIQRNDIIKVLPGSRIPADGKVIFGQSFVDESTITGESVPVLKNFGDEVFAGTLNQNQGLLMKVSSCGSHSTLSQIVKLIEQAQNTKAPIQKLSDQIAGRFTPFIIMFGVITFIVWVSLAASGAIPKSWVVHVTNGSDSAIQFALLFAISVIVISCPCALGLAVPTAIMVGSMMGAKNGLLFKSGAAFQLANNVNTIVFDKTGTLTIGKPCVTDILPLQPGVSTDELLTAAGTAEQLSEHPLALAIIAACQKPNISLLALPDKSVEAVEGRGIKCRIEDKNLEIFVGNKDFMSDCKIDVPTSAEDELHTLQDEGKTGLFVARNGVLLGILGIADMLKEDAVSGITVLKQLNYDIWICTGDNKRTADAIGRQLNIKPEHILAGVLPKDKAEKVRQLQSNDRIVAMIGDGVNDSPALAQADIGVALGAGTQIAIEAAQVVLVQNKIEDIVVVFDLAKKVFERIYINFGWAFVYNIAAVPIAAGILYPFTKIILPPQYAAIAMAASSVSVVMSSALLTRYRRPRITNRKSLFFYSSDKQWASWTKVSSVEVVEKH